MVVMRIQFQLPANTNMLVPSYFQLVLLFAYRFSCILTKAPFVHYSFLKSWRKSYNFIGFFKIYISLLATIKTTRRVKSSISSKRGSRRWSVHIDQNYPDPQLWQWWQLLEVPSSSGTWSSLMWCGVIFCSNRVKNWHKFGVRSGW